MSADSAIADVSRWHIAARLSDIDSHTISYHKPMAVSCSSEVCHRSAAFLGSIAGSLGRLICPIGTKYAPLYFSGLACTCRDAAAKRLVSAPRSAGTVTDRRIPSQIFLSGRVFRYIWQPSAGGVSAGAASRGMHAILTGPHVSRVDRSHDNGYVISVQSFL